PAPSSACTSAPGRAASRSAPASRDRRPGRSRAPARLTQLGEFGPVALELAALLLDHRGGSLGDEALVAELALAPLDLRPQLLAALAEALGDRLGVEL